MSGGLQSALEEGEKPSVVGVIVGDGAEKESVLRPDCLPSGEKLKWLALEKTVASCCTIRASANSSAVTEAGELLRHCHIRLWSSYFSHSEVFLRDQRV